METLTRCLNCLRLSLPLKGRCIFEDCARIPESVTEDRARFLMTMHGYRLNRNYVWLVENDDPENQQERSIGRFSGTWADAFRLLIELGFPKTGDIQCRECHNVDVPDLGDLCDACSAERLLWDRAEV